MESRILSVGEISTSPRRAPPRQRRARRESTVESAWAGRLLRALRRMEDMPEACRHPTRDFQIHPIPAVSRGTLTIPPVSIPLSEE
jgi:hypothetical protein